MVMGVQKMETQVAVIGAGPGGYTAAFRAADLGLDVALISDEEQLGGVCLLRGCIPSKALHEMAELIQQARQAAEHGVRFGQPEVDLDQLRSWKDGVVKRLADGIVHLCEQREIQVIYGRATFDGSHSLRIEGSDVSAVEYEHAILASGAHPVPLPGLDQAWNGDGRIMDSAQALMLPETPETLLVVGGGYIGLQTASIYAALGSRVTVVEATAGLLPGVDRELVKRMARRLKKEALHAVHVNTQVASLEETDDYVEVTLEGQAVEDGVEQPQRFDRVLLAVDRHPNSQNLGLENTAVQLDDDGFVVVDEQMRTTDDAIFAIGDVVGEPMFAHKAMHQAKIAAEVIAGQPAAFDVRCIPAFIATNPQVAWCGLMEDEAAQKGYEVEIGRFPWRASGRALIMDSEQGLVKLIFDAESGRTLGVGIVGEGAEIMISEGALAVEMGVLAEDLALTIHPHPTVSETLSGAAADFLGRATDILSKRR